MSVKKPQLIFLLLALLGFGIYKISKPQDIKRRSFSSQIHVSEYSSHGVVDRVIQLKIETVGDSEVTALISLPFNYEGELQYKWTLGQNVVLTKGVLEGATAKGFSLDTPHKIKISVQGFNPQNLRHIGFEVWGLKNNRRIYADALISSQKQNSFEDVVQHVEKIKAQKSGNDR